MSNSPCKLLAPGVIFFDQLFQKHTCEVIVKESEDKKSWVPARTGLYTNGILVDVNIYGNSSGVDVTEWKDNSSLIFPTITKLIEIEAETRWGVQITGYSSIAISRYSVGPGLLEHSDTGAFNTNRLLTVVMFLNDSYLGGNIKFPTQDIVIKPKKGDMIIFFSEYKHSVSSIIKGTRYALVFFCENEAITNYSYKG